MLRADLGTGLLEARAQATGHGYLLGEGGYSLLTGAFARGELAWHIQENLSAYAFGQWDKTEPRAGVGLKWEF